MDAYLNWKTVRMVNAGRVMCAVMTISATSVEITTDPVVMGIPATRIMSAVLTESAMGVDGSMTPAVMGIHARRIL